ncbi:MAG TPA: carbon starvation CstA family protein [Kofleriaceae bacterium]|nr:carbon starvation CstA family protein [Kofleriaceae bacterium]
MGLPLLAAVVVAALVLGYRFYGRWVARQFALDPARQTPAHTHEDGIDFVPTKPFYLFGQHFSAIAAAGPIVGPILACGQFGWLPCILWIGFGVVFIGAVHDVSTLVASVRHEGRTIAEVVKVNLGRPAWLTILTFIWLALVYVIVAFVDITAGTFVTKTTSAEGITTTFNQGGAVALAALLYLGLALVMGLVNRFLRPPLWLQTLIFVPATLFVIWFGTQHSTWILFTWREWVWLILAYCAVASVTPMWLLMQPRGYLGGFVLYGALLVGVIGIFFGGFSIEQPAWKGFDTPGATGSMFPFLFVTIACGACSGFHGLVCSGTTSKQIDNEAHCHPIGYGAMLLEAFVALIALATIMIVAKPTGGPGKIYSEGLARFITLVIGDSPEARQTAVTFGAMALSTFIFDTLDSATRLGRYILQELFNWYGKAAVIVMSVVTVGAPLYFLEASKSGSYGLFWTLFGTSNQLLASLSLLSISVWLWRGGKKPWFTIIPTVLVMAVTVTSLVLQSRNLARYDVGTTPWINGLVSVVLLALALALVVFAVRAVRRPAGAAV